MLEAICSRHGLVWICSQDPELVKEKLVRACLETNRFFYQWNLVEGFVGTEHDGKAKGSAMQAVDCVLQDQKNNPDLRAVYFLRDVVEILGGERLPASQIPLARMLAIAAEKLLSREKTILVVAPPGVLPPYQLKDILPVSVALPSQEELKNLIETICPKNFSDESGSESDNGGMNKISEAVAGLTKGQAIRTLASTLYDKETIYSEEAFLFAAAKKSEAIAQTGVLELVRDLPSLSDIGGLEKLKLWLKIRERAFEPEAGEWGVPSPKGMLLVGIPGTGKSLTAKAIASAWKLSLFRLDAGKLFGSLIGQTESRARQVMEIAEAAAPCVLWIDEIDKAFGNITSGSDGDSGTSRRVFGSLITWMQEKTASVFVVATANNVEILPAELLRKGRFDEIFFLDLPSAEERESIIEIHSGSPSMELSKSEIKELAQVFEGFVGAEIEASVKEARLDRYLARTWAGSKEAIARSAAQATPLSKLREADVVALRDWASRTQARKASSSVEQKAKETKPDEKGKMYRLNVDKKDNRTR